MIKISSVEPETEAWKAWIKKAEDERANLIKKVEENPGLAIGDSVAEELYKERKEDLFAPFHHKCAYCEQKVIGKNQRGDVEHFRPKAGVRDIHNKEVHIMDQAGRKIRHPGYYWLAYDWQNLFPSCITCNQLSGEGITRMGKGNRFPVADESRRVSSHLGDLTQEECLLIHPVKDDPEDHLILDPKKGILGGKTQAGEITIEVLGLNRELLLTGRKECYEKVVNAYSTWVAAMLEFLAAPLEAGVSRPDYKLKPLQEHILGMAEFSMVGRRAIKDAGELLQSAKLPGLGSVFTKVEG